MPDINERILDQLRKCVDLCNACFRVCLDDPNISRLIRCIELNRECAQMCQMTISMIERGSEHLNGFLDLCATICRACAEECANLQHQAGRQCAAIAGACAEACSAYSTGNRNIHAAV
jgi:hypothetical protein